MMRKLILLIIIFNNYQAQYSNAYIPTIYPISPDATKLAHYKEFPVNYFSGIFSTSIPIYKIKYNNFNWDINMAYSYTGLKVHEQHSMLGRGWTINNTGVIVREVRGLPDEGDGGLLKSGIAQKILNNYVNDGTINYGLFESVIDSNASDTQWDYYSLNFNGMHVNFKYNGVQVIPLSKTKIKIEKEATGFKVTDDKGILYKFNDTEYTYDFDNTVTLNYHFPTAFYLSEIQLQPDFRITFEYDDDIQFQSSYNVGTKTITHKSTAYESYYNGVLTKTIDRKILKRIISPNERLDFVSQNIDNNIDHHFNYKKIEVYNRKDKKITAFDFNYQNRFFLGEIIKDGIEKYSFEYNGTPMNLYPFAEDYWGYYNGRISNLGFLEYLAANNEASEASKMGALKKLIYPTKKYTEFEYELNTVKKNTSTFSNEKLKNLGYDYNKRIYLYFNSSLENIPNDQPKHILFVYQFNKKTKLRYNYSCTSSNNDQFLLSVKSNDNNNSPLYINQSKDVDQGISTSGYSGSNNDIIIYPGTYEFLISSNVHRNTIISFSMDFVEYDDVINYPSGGIRIKSIKNYSDDGSFTEKFIDYNNPDGFSSGEEMSPFYISGSKYNVKYCMSLPIDPNTGFTELLPIGDYIQSIETVSKNPAVPLSLSLGVNTYYNRVREFNGSNAITVSPNDSINNIILNKGNNTNNQPILFNINNSNQLLYTANLTKGYQEHIFDEPKIAYFEGGYGINDLTLGRILRQKIFDSENNLLRETNYTYENISSPGNYTPSLETYPYSMLIKRKKKLEFPNSTCIGENLSSLYSIILYRELDNNYAISSIKEINYFSPNNSIEENKIINYNSNGNVIMEKKSLSDSTQTEILYSYAHEKSNQYLIDKNMVGIPLQTTVIKTTNGVTKTLSDVETKYPATQTEADSKTTGLALPYEVWSKDFQGISNKEVLYKNYDDKGNLREYVLNPDTNGNGTPVAIIYGYNNTQPIAKIEGAKYDDIKTLQTIIDAVSASNSDTDLTSENILIVKLDLLRKDSLLSNYQITTYTYDPLIGVTSITPPSGIREIYQYDSANRLEKVVDVNGNILKEYKYNYKQ